MTKFSSLLVTFIVIGLFTFCLITWGYLIQTNNGATETIINDTIISSAYTKIQGNLSELQSTAQSQRESFEKDEASTGIGELIFGSIRGTAKVFTSSVISFIGIIGTLPAILGVPSIVLGVITAIFIVLIILSIWRLVKIGE